MKKWKRLLIALASVIIAVGFYLIFLRNNQSPTEVLEIRPDYSSRVRNPAPDFTLPTLGDNPARLSNYRGKVVFLNFWATWCPPCREEMPSMQFLYHRLKGWDFEMLTVSIDTKGADRVQSFVATYGLTFPVLLDPNKKVYRLYGLTGVPETFIIDKNGEILLRIIGPRDWMKKPWLEYFDRIIARSSSSTPGEKAFVVGENR
ncbi:MAG: redoxin domain-containing protein [Thermodesulfobacteriota bacterium]